VRNIGQLTDIESRRALTRRRSLAVADASTRVVLVHSGGI
jgi:hypothetical protein